MRISSSPILARSVVQKPASTAHKLLEVPRFGNRQEEGELNIPPKTLASILLGGLMALGGLVYVGNQHEQEQQKIRQQQIQTAQDTFGDEWKQAKTTEAQMQFIRQTLGKKLTTVKSDEWFNEDGNKLAEWAAEKIIDIPTDRNKVRLILDGLLTNPGVILGKQKQLLAHIEDLPIKEKLSRLFELQPGSSGFSVKIEINGRKKDEPETDRDKRFREWEEKIEAERAARKAEFEKVKDELKAFALENPKN